MHKFDFGVRGQKGKLNAFTTDESDDRFHLIDHFIGTVTAGSFVVALKMVFDESNQGDPLIHTFALIHVNIGADTRAASTDGDGDGDGDGSERPHSRTA